MLNLGKKGSLREHLIRAASGSFIIRVSTTALSLITAVVLARLLGAEGFGIYAFCFSVSQILGRFFVADSVLFLQKHGNYWNRKDGI